MLRASQDSMWKIKTRCNAIVKTYYKLLSMNSIKLFNFCAPLQQPYSTCRTSQNNGNNKETNATTNLIMKKEVH